MSLQYLREEGLEGIGRYYSIYRGLVIDNKDPDSLNRLKVEVPEITRNLVWAFPKSQAGNLKSGQKYLTPNIGDVVFIEFETGDPNFPIWSYCGWAKGQIPPELESLSRYGIITPNGNKIILDDETNEVKISFRVSENEFHTFTVSPNKIDIQSPTPIEITSEKDTNINGENIILNKGKIGTTMTDKLLQRINALENDINSLKDALKIAMSSAVPQDGGKAAFSSMSGYFSSKLTLTTMEDIEHKTVKQ